MDAVSLDNLPITWLETTLKARRIPWGMFTIIVCALQFLVEIAYGLRPDVNGFWNLVVSDVVLDGYLLTMWTFSHYFLSKALKSIEPLTKPRLCPITSQIGNGR
jgi:hypothetical protein